MLDPEDLDRYLANKLAFYMTKQNKPCHEQLKKCRNILQRHCEDIKEYLASSEENDVKIVPDNLLSNDKEHTLTKCGLNLSQIQRYSRQLILPEIRVSGQKKLKASSVLIVGAGGLGCPAALYLAASGIGRIGVVDADTVDLSNLHRQIAHKERKLGQSKSDSLCQAVEDLNTDVDVVSYKCSLTSQNAIKILNDNYDVILDATDNPATRYLINDACQLSGKYLPVLGVFKTFD